MCGLQGSLVKLQTFTPVKQQPALAGTACEVCGWSFDAGPFGGEAEEVKAKKDSGQCDRRLRLRLGNVEKANLVAEI